MKTQEFINRIEKEKGEAYAGCVKFVSSAKSLNDGLPQLVADKDTGKFINHILSGVVQGAMDVVHQLLDISDDELIGDVNQLLALAEADARAGLGRNIQGVGTLVDSLEQNDTLENFQPTGKAN